MCAAHKQFTDMYYHMPFVRRDTQNKTDKMKTINFWINKFTEDAVPGRAGCMGCNEILGKFMPMQSI